MIGEKTSGGLNARASYRIHPHFEAYILIGRTLNPLTGTSWELFGSTPEISVPQAHRFDVAHKLAHESALTEIDASTAALLRDLVADARIALMNLDHTSE